MKQDTIAAIATASGQGGIGIIRLSGEESVRILADHLIFIQRHSAALAEKLSRRTKQGIDGNIIFAG